MCAAAVAPPTVVSTSPAPTGCVPSSTGNNTGNAGNIIHEALPRLNQLFFLKISVAKTLSEIYFDMKHAGFA